MTMRLFKRQKEKKPARTIVTLPRILSEAEVFEMAIKICPRDQFGLVKMEDVEKARKIVRDINFWLVEL